MIRREVTIGNCRLILGDCREIAPTLTGIDAVVSDPPYGMNWDTDTTRFSGGGRGRGRGRGRGDHGPIIADAEPFDPAPWLDYPEVILFGSNHYAQRLPVGITLVWLKKFPHAYGTFLSDAEIGWQKGGHGVYCLHAPDSNTSRMRENGDGNNKTGNVAHPTQKPLALMRWCIGRTKGQTILDPYMGSGTTGVACAEMGRAFVGIEIDEKHFETACRRIERLVSQGDMLRQPAAAPSVKQHTLTLA